MRFSIAEFDDLVNYGAEYISSSKVPHPGLDVDGRFVVDTPDDFVVLENALFTWRCGLVWKDLWLGPAIQYLPHNWMAAPWLPGTLEETDLSITIPDDDLSPTRTLDGLFFYVDWAGRRGYGDYIHDTLPYGAFFQRVRSFLPNVRPLVGPSNFLSVPTLFTPVFDFPFSEVELFDPSSGPTLVRLLAIGRRQTDMAGIQPTDHWSVPFEGWRHVRKIGHQKWGQSNSNRLKVFFHRYQSPKHLEFLKQTNRLHGRNFANMGALLEMLVDNGFIGLEPGNIPVESVVNITTQAETLVGVHGAGLSNLMFAPEMTHVFEIRSHLGAWPSLQCMATVLGHKFHALPQANPLAEEPPILDIQWIREQILGSVEAVDG